MVEKTTSIDIMTPVYGGERKDVIIRIDDQCDMLSNVRIHASGEMSTHVIYLSDGLNILDVLQKNKCTGCFEYNINLLPMLYSNFCFIADVSGRGVVRLLADGVCFVPYVHKMIQSVWQHPIVSDKYVYNKRVVYTLDGNAPHFLYIKFNGGMLQKMPN